MWQPKHSIRMLSTGFAYRQVHYSDDPERDYAWAKDKSIEYGGMSSPRWQREMEINWRTYIGDRVWPMLSRQYHNRRVYLDKEWALYRVIDHGVRHPTCCLWIAVNRSGDRHVYREYYMTDVPVSVNCQNIIRMTGNEQIIGTYIDPSTRQRVNRITGDGDADRQGMSKLIDIYSECGLYCEKADNSAAGYDKVTNALMSRLARVALYEDSFPAYLSQMDLNKDQLLSLSSSPALTFDVEACPRSFNEVENLRWRELTGDVTQRASSEKTVDVDDEGADCVRYSFTDGIFWRLPVYRPQHGSWRDKIVKRQIDRVRNKYHKWN